MRNGPDKKEIMINGRLHRVCKDCGKILYDFTTIDWECYLCQDCGDIRLSEGNYPNSNFERECRNADFDRQTFQLS